MPPNPSPSNQSWANFGQAPLAQSNPNPWGQVQQTHPAAAASPFTQTNAFGFPNAQQMSQSQGQHAIMGNGTGGFGGQVASNPWSVNGAEFNGTGGGQFMASTPNPFAVSYDSSIKIIMRFCMLT
jgi:hypothetical protein